MFVDDIIEKIDQSNHLISMTPVEKIIELGYILNLNPYRNFTKSL
jgi:hypothetical protein